jgi:hypothetical protein
MHSLREPLTPVDRNNLQLLLNRIRPVQAEVDRRGSIYARTVGNTSKLAGFLTGATREIEELLEADDAAERERSARRFAGESA